MTFLYEYMNSDELAIAKESAQIDSEALKLEHAFNIAEMRHEIRMSDIEVNSFVNECTESDLTAMYAREMDIYMEETQSIWQKFKNFIKGIINKILGRSKDIKNLELENPDDSIDLPFSPAAAKKFLADARNAIKQFLVPTNSEGVVDTSEQTKNLVILGTTLTATATAATILKEKVLKPTKMSRKEAKDAILEVSNETNEFLNQSLADGDKISEKDSSGKLSTVMSIIKAPVQALNAKINEAKAKLFGGKSEDKGEGKTDDKAASDEGESKDGKPEAAKSAGEEKLSEVLSKTESNERIESLRNYANEYRKDLGIDEDIETKDIVIDLSMLSKIRNHMKKAMPDRAKKWGPLMAYVQQHKGDIKFNEATRYDPILAMDVFYEYDYHAMDDDAEYVGESSLNIEDFMNPSPRGDMTELLELVDNL